MSLKHGRRKLTIAFLLYCLFILWYTLFSRNPTAHRCELRLFWALRDLITLQPDGAKNTIQYIGNIVFFVPFGFMFPWKKSWKIILAVSFLASSAIESAQYVFSLGLAELDDVIANTLGGVIGYRLFLYFKKAKEVATIMNRNQGIYETYFKRIIDIICALLAIIVFCWLYAIIAILVKIKLGSPVIFKQPRPGKDEKIFMLYKFRTMSDEQDESGNLLPDHHRLTPFGEWLRNSSMDELPEAFNILKGDMSVIGPRPQLVRDMVFMTPEQRQRHTAKPGLSGLAQTRGRNALSWDGKLATDLEYIQHVTFAGDVKIVIDTVKQVFFKEKGLEDCEVDEVALADDFGDFLLKEDRVTKEEYESKMLEAKQLLEGHN